MDRSRRSSIWSDPRVKPPYGAAELNRSHPLAQGMMILDPFNTRAWLTPASAGTYPYDPGPRLGNRGLPAYNLASATSSTWVVNELGPAILFVQGDSQYTSYGDGVLTTPTAHGTVLVIRRKVDTTARASSIFGVQGQGTEAWNVHGPWSDGTVYFDFGGQTGVNRLTYTWSATTRLERFAFIGGPRGSAIYLNGALQASQSTAISRTSTSGAMRINRGAGTAVGDDQEISFFAVLDAEWTQDMVQWWTVEPFAMFQPVIRRRWFIPAVAGARQQSLTLIGVGV